MSWVYLFVAGLFEIGWPLGLKFAQDGKHMVAGIALAVVSMGISGALLFLAQKQIAIGTAYAVWTGIGAAGTFLVGIWLFGDATSLGRYAGVALIIAGVITALATGVIVYAGCMMVRGGTMTIGELIAFKGMMAMLYNRSTA